MTTKTETLHAGGFLVSDVHGYCYEKGTLASGQNLAAGTVLMLNGSSKYVAYDGGSDSTAVAILFDSVNATSGDKSVAVLARGPAEVRLSDLTYPAGDDTNVKADLKALSPPIITR